MLIHTGYKGSIRNSQRTYCVRIRMLYILKQVRLLHGQNAHCGVEHGGTRGSIFSRS